MTKEISKKEVEKICDLANINVDESEKEKFAEELGDILTYVEKLDELDTDGIEPTAYPVPLRNVLREDKVGKSLAKEKAVENAPEKYKNQIKVPPIMSD